MKSIIAFFVICTAHAHIPVNDSQSIVDLDYWTIGEVIVTEVDDAGNTVRKLYTRRPTKSIENTKVPLPKDPKKKPGNGNGSGSKAKTIIGDFIILGEKILEVIKENQPQINIEDPVALDVLPQIAGVDELAAFDLGGWSLPQVKNYAFEFKNLYGSNVVTINYRVFYSYGGSYDGNGQYLSGVIVEPKSINAKWGFTVDMESTVVSLTNVSTKKSPIPALTLQLRYHIHSWMSDIENRETYTILGDGRFITYK